MRRPRTVGRSCHVCSGTSTFFDDFEKLPVLYSSCLPDYLTLTRSIEARYTLQENWILPENAGKRARVFDLNAIYEETRAAAAQRSDEAQAKVYGSRRSHRSIAVICRSCSKKLKGKQKRGKKPEGVRKRAKHAAQGRELA